MERGERERERGEGGKVKELAESQMIWNESKKYSRETKKAILGGKSEEITRVKELENCLNRRPVKFCVKLLFLKAASKVKRLEGVWDKSDRVKIQPQKTWEPNKKTKQAINSLSTATKDNK